MRRLILPPLFPLDLLNSPEHPLPDGAPVHVATLQHGVRMLGSLQGGARAVLADQDATGSTGFALGWEDPSDNLKCAPLHRVVPPAPSCRIPPRKCDTGELAECSHPRVMGSITCDAIRWISPSPRATRRNPHKPLYGKFFGVISKCL